MFKAMMRIALRIASRISSLLLIPPSTKGKEPQVYFGTKQPMEQTFADAVDLMARSVHAFHDRFGMAEVEPESSDMLSFHRVRTGLLMEELGEYASVANRQDNEKAKLEAADCLYVALGTMLQLGNEGISAIIEVTIKNNRKTVFTHSKNKAGKAQKLAS